MIVPLVLVNLKHFFILVIDKIITPQKKCYRESINLTLKTHFCGVEEGG